MDVSALIVLPSVSDSGDELSLGSSSEFEDEVKAVTDILPDEIGHVSVMVPSKYNALKAELPVLYTSEKGVLASLLIALQAQESGLLLVLDAKPRTREQIESMLDYSSRLPHMTVVATENGLPLLFPMILPASAKEDIEMFMHSGELELEQWLAQGVYVECELAGPGS